MEKNINSTTFGTYEDVLNRPLWLDYRVVIESIDECDPGQADMSIRRKQIQLALITPCKFSAEACKNDVIAFINQYPKQCKVTWVDIEHDDTPLFY